MSQAKVDRYKKEKADRKKTMRKEKIMRNVKRCVAGVIVLAIVGWFGYSAYDLHSSNQERAVAEENNDSLKDNLSTLQQNKVVIITYSAIKRGCRIK